MKIGSIAVNWFDLVVIVVLTIGVLRGRKRGMSEELLDVFQWLCIIILGALFYRPIGELVSNTTKMDIFFGNILAYGFIAMLIKLLMTAVKRSVGEKLVQSDAFGRFEYYLGMMAGALRLFCILLFCINFIYAKYISDAERAATAKMQRDNFGTISFPTFGSIREGIFYGSSSGKLMRKYLRAQLIEPASGKPASGESIFRKRQSAVDEVLK